jgi:adenylate cyclase
VNTVSPSLRALRLWHRVPVRLTFVYGLALLATLTPAAFLVYRLAVDAELDNLSSRIRATTVSLSTMVDPAALAAVDRVDAPYRRTLEAHFNAIVRQAPELASIYIFAPTERPDRMRFIVDVDVRKAPGVFGTLYDASRYPELMAGVAGATVEPQPIADEWGFSLSGFAPIREVNGTTVGILGVDVDAARLEQAETRLLHIALAVYSGVLVLLVLGALGVARILRRPLSRIIAATDDIAANRLDARVGDLGHNEFGVLGRHFDLMAKGLEEREHIRRTFGRYVSDEVARKLLAEDKADGVFGEERVITVLFSDLRGYSTISEGLAPTDVLRIMNEYLELMNRVITSQGGCIIEYTGDGILAVFGAPDDLPDQATHATRSALAMRDSLEALNAFWDKKGTSAAWKSRGLDRLTARIGLHKGPVVAGSLGSSLRMKYTLLGDTVNIAARLERLNIELDSSILMSREVFDELPSDLRALATPRGDHRVKGRSKPVEVLSL